MKIPIKILRDGAQVPERASAGAIGYDVWASAVLSKETKKVLQELPFTLEPGKSVLIGIGVAFAVPWPWMCDVRPRSGLANKHDIELSNSPGTIDPDFRGEAGVLLRNRGDKSFTIERGMRIAQLVFIKAQIPEMELADELPGTKRGAGGFGSTGLFEIEKG
ncbi:MAG: dUTP diphosphatase [Candidatus Staskawiczbacteria bacterium]|jgi:dUTP pyrophosphatase